LWASDTSSGVHTPASTVSYNSTGSTNHYDNQGWATLAEFPMLDTPPYGGATGVVQLSSYGFSGEFCNLTLTWGQFDVYCFNTGGTQISGKFDAARLWY